MLQTTASRSCNGYRTTRLGSYSESLDDSMPCSYSGSCTGCPFSSGSTTVALQTFKVHSTSTPLYLRRLIKEREHVYNLRFATTSLSQPSSRTTFAKRTFRCTVPAIWNSLPKTVIDSDSITVFKYRLKTFLFSQAYSLPFSHSH